MGFAQCCEGTADGMKVNERMSRHDFTGEKESFDLKMSF